MNFKQTTITLIFFAFLGCVLQASEPYYEQRYEAAHEAYKEGRFDTAQALYSEIVQNGMVSADLFYNLGNTHFRKGNIPEAILFYERALRRAPQDEDIRYNLKITEGYLTDKIEPIEDIFIARWWKNIAMNFRPDTWAIIGIALLFIMSAFFTAFVLAKKRRVKQLGLMGGVVMLLSCVITFFLASTANEALNSPAAIVFAPSVNVKSEPGLNAKDQFVIHEGVKVDVLDEEGDWSRIQLQDGNSGWLQSAAIEEI